jgi:hypothetical protein
MAKLNSKFRRGSIAHARRAIVLGEIVSRMQSPPDGGDARQIKLRTGGGKSFSDLQDAGTQDALIRRRNPSLARETRDAA